MTRHTTYPGIALDRRLERRRELVSGGYAEGVAEAERIMETGGLLALERATRNYKLRAQATSDARLIGRADGCADVLDWNKGGDAA